jgi:hypothetical protein
VHQHARYKTVVRAIASLLPAFCCESVTQRHGLGHSELTTPTHARHGLHGRRQQEQEHRTALDVGALLHDEVSAAWRVLIIRRCAALNQWRSVAMVAVVADNANLVFCPVDIMVYLYHIHSGGREEREEDGTEFRAHSNTYMYGSDAFSVGVHVRGFKII